MTSKYSYHMQQQYAGEGLPVVLPDDLHPYGYMFFLLYAFVRFAVRGPPHTRNIVNDPQGGSYQPAGSYQPGVITKFPTDRHQNRKSPLPPSLTSPIWRFTSYDENPPLCRNIAGKGAGKEKRWLRNTNSELYSKGVI